MHEPRDYLAMVALQAALQAISVGGGYYYDVRGTFVKLDPDHGVEELIEATAARPLIFLELQPEQWEYTGAQSLKVRQPVLIHWISESRPDRDADPLQTFLRGCADVERAITRDLTLGGTVRDIKITGRLFNRDLGSEVWAIVNTVMVIHRVFGEPTA